MSTRNISWGVKAAGARTNNLTTFMRRLSSNLGASTSWNPQGLPRPVQELLYVFITQDFKIIFYFTSHSVVHWMATGCFFAVKIDVVDSSGTSVTFCQLPEDSTWGVQVLRYPDFFSGMEADRNVKVVGGDVAVL